MKSTRSHILPQLQQAIPFPTTYQYISDQIGEEGMKVLTSSSADFKATGMQTSTIPTRAIAVLRFQCTGLQYGPPVILQTLALKSPPWEWSPPPAIFPLRSKESSEVTDEKIKINWAFDNSLRRNWYSPNTRVIWIDPEWVTWTRQ